MTDIILRIIFLMDFYQSPTFLFLCLWLLDFDSELYWISLRSGSRATATSKMEGFVVIVNGFQPLTIITKHCILDVAAALDPPLSPYLCLQLITLLVLCENSLKFLLCKRVLRGHLSSRRSSHTKKWGSNKKKESNPSPFFVRKWLFRW